MDRLSNTTPSELSAGSGSLLLRHLDSLRPLLVSDDSLIKASLARFEFLQSKVRPPDPPLTLSGYDLSLMEAMRFFPSQEPAFHRLLQLLVIDDRILGPRLNLLDIFTSLVLLSRMSLESKAKYLFLWYNTSKNGVMTEVEQTNMILKIADVLHRTQFIGKLDVTEDDARHIALTSRVYRDDDLPLYGEGFTDFSQYYKSNTREDVTSEAYIARASASRASASVAPKGNDDRSHDANDIIGQDGQEDGSDEKKDNSTFNTKEAAELSRTILDTPAEEEKGFNFSDLYKSDGDDGTVMSGMESLESAASAANDDQSRTGPSQSVTSGVTKPPSPPVGLDSLILNDKITTAAILNPTDDISSHTAKNKLSKIRFLPGLRFEDFYRWIQVSKEAHVLRGFVIVLDRFVDALFVLHARTNAVAAIINQKQAYHHKDWHVPKMDILPTLTSAPGGSIHVVGRYESTLCVVIDTSYFHTKVKEIYVKCEKLEKVPRPFYPIPKAIEKRTIETSTSSGTDEAHSGASDAKGLCCERTYSLDSYQRINLSHNRVLSAKRSGHGSNASENKMTEDASSSHYTTSVPPTSITKKLIQVPIRNLDADARYRLTLYTCEVKFPSIEASTLPQFPPFAPSMEMKEATVIKRRLNILPADLTLQDSLSFLEHTPLLTEGIQSTTVYTGSLTPIEACLRQSLLYTQSNQSAGLYSHVIAGIAASVNSHMDYNFIKGWDKLYSVVSNVSTHIEGLIASHKDKQVLCYNGIGCWDSTYAQQSIQEYIKNLDENSRNILKVLSEEELHSRLNHSGKLDLNAFSGNQDILPHNHVNNRRKLYWQLKKKLDEIYASRCAELAMQCACMRLGPVEMMFIGNQSSPISTAMDAALHLMEHKSIYNDSGTNTKEHDLSSKQGRGTGELVIVIRSPLDLLQFDMPQYWLDADRPDPSTPNSTAYKPLSPAASPQGEFKLFPQKPHMPRRSTKDAPGEMEGLVEMPVLASIVDAPTDKQVASMKESVQRSQEDVTNTNPPADGGDNGEIVVNGGEEAAEEEGDTGMDEYQQQLHQDFISNKWPHQRDGQDYSKYYQSKQGNTDGLNTPRRGGDNSSSSLSIDAVTINKDEDFAFFISILLQWLAQGFHSTEEGSRHVRLVSVGWCRGINFEIVANAYDINPSLEETGVPDRKLRIIHESLLPTRGSNTHTRDGGSGDNLNSTQLKVDIEKECDHEVDIIMKVLTSSLPHNTSLTIAAPSDLRIMSVPSTSEQGADGAIAISMTVEFLASNRVVDKNSDKIVVSDLPRVQIKDGPRIVRLDVNSTSLVCDASGYGRMTCTLYELPFELDYVDANALLISERQHLLAVQSITKRVTKARSVTFTFNSLRPYCNYCAVIDIHSNSVSSPFLTAKFKNDEKTMIDVMNASDYSPHVVQFRTKPQQHSRTCSTIIASTSEADLAMPSFGLRKIEELLAGIRPPAASVHLLHHPARDHALGDSGPEKPHKVGVQNLYKRTEVVHLLPSQSALAVPLDDRGRPRWGIKRGVFDDQKEQSFSTLYLPYMRTDMQGGCKEVGEDVHRAGYKDAYESLQYNINIGNNLAGTASSDGMEGISTDRASATYRLTDDAFGRVWEGDHSYDSNFVAVQVSINGRFCRLTPRDSSRRCLLRVIEIVQKLHLSHPKIDNIMVFVHKPLLRYLCKQKYRASGAVNQDPPTGLDPAAIQLWKKKNYNAHVWKWDYEGGVSDPSFDRSRSYDHHSVGEYNILCANLCSILIHWKHARAGRDAQVICMAEVKRIQVARIGYNLREIEEQRRLDALAAEVNWDIMTSSVAYSDHGHGPGSSIEGSQSQVGTQSIGTGADSRAQSRGNGSRASARGSQASQPQETEKVEEKVDVESKGPKVFKGLRSDKKPPPAASAAVEDVKNDPREKAEEEKTDTPAEVTLRVVDGEEFNSAKQAETTKDETVDLIQTDTPADGPRESGEEGEAVREEEVVTGQEGGEDGKQDPFAASSEPEGVDSDAVERVGDADHDGEGDDEGVLHGEERDVLLDAAGSITSAGPLTPGGGAEAVHGDDVSVLENPDLVSEGGDGTQTLNDESTAKGGALQSPGSQEDQYDYGEIEEEYIPDPECTIRHLILPLWVSEDTANVEENIIFPIGMNNMWGRMDYEVEAPDMNAFSDDNELLLQTDCMSTPLQQKYNIEIEDRRSALYGSGVNLGSRREEAVYLFDVFIKPGEGSWSTDAAVESDDILGYDGSIYVPPAGSQHLREEQSEFHTLIPRVYVNHLDMADITVGPVIGDVGEETATFVMELNYPLRQLSICVRPLGRTQHEGVPVDKNLSIVTDISKAMLFYVDAEEEETIHIQQSIKAYKAFTVNVEGLKSDRLYGIFVPELYGKKRLGCFRTLATFSRYAEVVISGGNPLHGNPSIDNIFSSYKIQQIVHSRHLIRELRQIYSCNVSALMAVDHKVNTDYELRGGSYPAWPWTWMAEHLQTPCSDARMTLHLGESTMLSAFFKELIELLMYQAHRIRASLPLSEATAVGGYYFNQFEETVRDSFRAVFAIPAIREVLSSGSNVQLFHSEYLLSFRDLPLNMTSKEHGANDEDLKLLAVIRKVYDTYFHTYMSTLYSFNSEEKGAHHGRVFRTGPLAYIVLDIVTGRKKAKKKKDGDGDDDNTKSTENDKRVKGKRINFSQGFLDKQQWKLIEAVSEDERVSHIIIVTQKPFIKLTPLPRIYENPEKVEKGEMLEWNPTHIDLKAFFGYWVEWLQPKEGKPRISKVINVVSTYRIPYVTQIQDLYTGVKIQQLCIGDTGIDKPFKEEALVEEKDDMSSLAEGASVVGDARRGESAALSGGMKIMGQSEEEKAEAARQKMVLSDPSAAPPSPSVELGENSLAQESSLLPSSLEGSTTTKTKRSSVDDSFAVESEEDAKKAEAEEEAKLAAIEERPEDYEDYSVPRMEEMVLTGKIGGLRYKHVFSGQDALVVDSTREGASLGSASLDLDPRTLRKPSYGVLRYVFDTWKATGTWCVHTQSEQRYKPPGPDAILTVGPIIGAPHVHTSHETVVNPSSTNTELVERLVLEVPILLESDRDTTIVISVRHALNGSVREFSFDMVGNRPRVCRIEPLEIDSRYNCEIIAGIREYYCQSFVIGTEHSTSDNNVYFVNFTKAPDTVPQADFALDLNRRFNVPFNGISVSVHMNSYPEHLKDVVDELKRLPILKEGLAECLEKAHLTKHFYEVMRKCMEVIREAYRQHFSRPSYAALLKSCFTLLMQTHSIFGEVELDFKEELGDEEDDEEEDADKEEKEEEEDEPEPPKDEVMRLVKLMAMRVHQEYCDQLNTPRKNVFRAQKSNEGAAVELNMNLSPEELKRIEDEDNRKALIMEELSMLDFAEEEGTVVKFNDRADCIKVIFKQWLMNMGPCPPQWTPYITPNRHAIIERAPSVLQKNLPQVLQLFKKKCPIEHGNRLVVVDGNVDGSGPDNALTPGVKIGSKYWMQAKKWLYPHPWYPQGQTVKFTNEDGEEEEKVVPVIRDDRAVAFICPSQKYGTQLHRIQACKENDGLHANIYTVDSIYKCNEEDRSQKVLAVEASVIAEQNDPNRPKAKTKQQKKMQKEADERLKERRMKELQDIFDSYQPDGYLVMECRTPTMVSYGHADILNTCHGKVVSSMTGFGGPEEEALWVDPKSERPSPYDYINLPEWIVKYFPSKDGVFAQDELLLWMRENSEISRILKVLEGQEVVHKVIELYERSRLSELSRPADLREVNMDLPGVKGLFVKDIIERVWSDVVPEAIKDYLVPIDDDFMRCFILARAIPDPDTQLADSQSFARAIQYALVLAVSLKTSLRMQADSRYKYLMDEMDGAQAAAQAKADKDKARQVAHDRAKIQQGDDYDFAATEAEHDAYEEEMAKRDAGYESDIAELEAEEAYVEEEEIRLEELDEMAARMEEVDGEDRDLLEEAEEEIREKEEAEREDEEGGEGSDEDGEGDDTNKVEGVQDEEELAAEKAERKAKREARQKAQGTDKPNFGKNKQSMAEKNVQNSPYNRISEIKAIQQSTMECLDELFVEMAQKLALEKVRELEQEEMLAALPEPVKEERLSKSKLHMARLAEERVATKRAFGPKTIHLK